MKISVAINVDSRPGVEGDSSKFQGHNNGVRNWDLLTHGIENKRRFFEGFECEFIVYLDETAPVSDETIRTMRSLCDCLIIRKHFTGYRGVDVCGFANDIRYLQTLSQATGELVVHFDADTVAFARDKTAVEKWLSHLDQFSFVSYPSAWSPRAVHDESFGPHTWASTRAFACRRDALKFDDLERGLRNPDWLYERYGTPVRQLNWLEHFLARTSNDSVLYPPRDDENLLIWCWHSYVSGALPKLNARSFNEVRAYVEMCGGIHYPNDLQCLHP